MTDRLYRVKETIRRFLDSDDPDERDKQQNLANKHLLAANY